MDPGSALYQVHSRPQLERPVLVTAPEGWIDAGLGGANAVAAILAAVETELVASFDADRLLDHRARRPVSHIVDGVYTDLAWPRMELHAGHDADGNALLVLAGPEPDHEWRAYAEAVTELATEFGVRLLVGLGAFPAGVPHTRPSRLAATATTAELANQVGVVSGTVEVPAGVLAAIERRCAERGVATVALWARVPHYAATMPYPPASVLLIEGLAAVAGIRVEVPELREQAELTRKRLDELTANSVQHTALVRQLEAQLDEEMAGLADQAQATAEGWGNLPSGDELAAEVERFLRGENPESH